MANCIYDEIRQGIARVSIFDYGRPTSLGRYQIQRCMKLANGQTRVTYGYRHQRPGAIAYAKKWLNQRQALLSQTAASSAGKEAIA